MNNDIFSGMWKQVRGRVKSAWGKLTDDDMQEIDGNKDVLIGKLQEKYGWTKERAENEVDRVMARSDADADLS